MEIKFKLSDRWGDTSLEGYITTSYEKLVKIFGEPNSDGDGYKVSTEWSLEDELGNPATIYDWKSTNLYNDSSYSVADLRDEKKYEWHIGAENKHTANKLRNYILSQI